jgi:hypothetical protein
MAAVNRPLASRPTTPVYLTVVDQTYRHPPVRISLPVGITQIGRGNGIETSDSRIAPVHLEITNDGHKLFVRGVRLLFVSTYYQPLWKLRYRFFFLQWMIAPLVFLINLGNLV